MTRITIYRVGQAEPVRIAGPTVPEPLGGAATARSRGYVRWLKPCLLIALFAAAVVLSLLYGREVYADITGVAGVAGHLRRLPHWLHYGVPAVAALLFVLVTYYLAFGRHVVLKAVTLGFFIALLATPGFALGYVNGNLSTMGSGGTAEQRAAVKSAQSVVQRPLPNKPMNILLLGIDHAGPGDPGRSDSQILVRLDPQLKTISMLSLPRDLRWNIPGIGVTKMNAAYTYGGPRLAIKTFEDITGLPINYFIRVDFAGFWHIVDIVGGVYLPIDHRYYVPVGAGFQSIDLQPGYQLLKAKQSLNFVRFRHDQNGDFTRMVRQQMFLREVQRQALRWSGNWGRVLAMTRAIMGQTTTDLDSLSKLLPVVNLALTLNTAHIYQTHVEGSTPTINGVDYVVDTSEQIAAAVQQFENPGQPKASTAGSAVPKSAYLVTVSNGNGSPGLAQRTAAALQARGYHVGAPPDLLADLFADGGLRAREPRCPGATARQPLHAGHRAAQPSGAGQRWAHPDRAGQQLRRFAHDRDTDVASRSYRRERPALRLVGVARSGEDYVAQARGADSLGARPRLRHGRRALPLLLDRDHHQAARRGSHRRGHLRCGLLGRAGHALDESAGDRQPKLGAEDRRAHLPLLLPGQKPAHGRLEGEWLSLLGRQHARQPDSQ